jgi:hypothetical protein
VHFAKAPPSIKIDTRTPSIGLVFSEQIPVMVNKGLSGVSDRKNRLTKLSVAILKKRRIEVLLFVAFMLNNFRISASAKIGGIITWRY